LPGFSTVCIESSSFLPRPTDFADLEFRNAAIPGGTLVGALWHRDLMRLSDRGRASELVGDRWAELCASALNAWIGTNRPLAPGSDGVDYRVGRIARLDDIPAIAEAASRQQLQNPDFLLIGSNANGSVVQPADAKFSVETAKVKQVSADVAAGLIGLGPVITDHIPSLDDAVSVVDGFFLCPDFSLTHHMLQRRQGTRGSVGVPVEQVSLVSVTPDAFMQPVDGRDLALWLATRDSFPISPHESLAFFLYYFRLARACVGCWVDQTAPLLAYRDKPDIDLEIVHAFARDLAQGQGSAWQLVLDWDARAETVRRQRAAVDHAAALPMASYELKNRIEAVSKRAGLVAPSTSKVRRAVGSWFRSRLREEFGEVTPPVDQLPAMLRNLHTYAQGLRPALLVEVDETTVRFAASSEPAEEPVPAAQPAAH
jgi:hypothetical protein